MTTNCLLIFYRNPELGRVKTRLAATLGDAAALAVYLRLAQHTRTVAEELHCNRIVFYSDYIDSEDNWNNLHFIKQLQEGKDLGERMMNAFASAFEMGYKKVCIIGTDCPTLDKTVLTKAFTELQQNEVVIGPATDGGYYLLGMNHLHRIFFEHKRWSTKTVAAETINNCRDLNLSFSLLPVLSDVDEETDLPLEYHEFLDGI